MPRIPEETLQHILSATDIVDLVGRYVKLRRVGTNYRGLCPFHQEKTPSFYVNPQRGSYHCFGCGVGGSAIRFIMEHEGLQFMETVKRLADAAGIRIQEEEFDAEADKAARIRKALLKVHAEIAEWYHTLLMKDPVAEPARDYLKSRGINAATVKSWQMGYAPASGEMLREWAQPQKFTENLLVAAGILARGDEEYGRGGEVYPRFRHRLMFPIRNDYGEVIAFSGRMLDANAKAAKYLNSPETSIFNKSKVFFGLDKSKRAIIKAQQAIVCEGQLDLITAFEHGFENVVAPLGTAFTEFHARALKRHAEEVVLCFDSDNAGYKAAERAFVILAPTGLTVKVAPLPQGEDPDSLIRGQGPEVFRAVLESARDFFEHMVDHAGKNRNLHETREKTQFAAEMAAMIALQDNPIARDAAIQRVSIRLGIPEAEYRRQVARVMRAPQTQQRNSGEAGSTVKSAPLPPQDKTASLLCRLALSDAEILCWLRGMNLEDVLNEVSGTELLAFVWKSKSDLADDSKMSAFLATLSREEESALSQLLSKPMPKGGLKQAQEALARLQVDRLDKLVQLTQSKLKQPGLDASEYSDLTKEFVRLSSELKRCSALLPPLKSNLDEA